MYSDPIKKELGPQTAGAPSVPGPRPCRGDLLWTNLERAAQHGTAGQEPRAVRRNLHPLHRLQSRAPSGATHSRRCRRGEVDTWIGMQADDPQKAERHRPFMKAYFDRLYAPRRSTSCPVSKGRSSRSFSVLTILATDSSCGENTVGRSATIARTAREDDYDRRRPVHRRPRFPRW